MLRRYEIFGLFTSPVVVSMTAVFGHDILSRLHIPNSVIERVTQTGAASNGLRKTFIHFVMSFFIEKNAPVVCKLLERKGKFCIGYERQEALKLRNFNYYTRHSIEVWFALKYFNLFQNFCRALYLAWSKTRHLLSTWF